MKLGMGTHFSKLAYAMIKNGKYNYVSQLILFVRLPKLGMGTHFYQNKPVL